MKTDSLTVFPHQKVVSTKDAVVILQPDLTIHAIGMTANIDEGTVKLLSQARGEYAPRS